MRFYCLAAPLRVVRRASILHRTKGLAMSRQVRLAIVCTLMIMLAGIRHVRADEYGPLLVRLPQSVNTLILIDAGSVFSSAYGEQQQWRGKYAKRFDASPSMLPPTTDVFVWGAELNLETMSPTTQYAVMKLSRDLSMPQLAKWIGGTLNTIAGLQAVATPRGGMAIKFSQTDYALIVPASRQRAAGWIRESTDASGQSLSPYLQQVVSDESRIAAHLCQAIDLTNAVNRQAVETALSRSAVVKQHGLDIQQVAELLAGIRGVNVLVSFTDKATGKMMVDFDGNTTVLKDAAKPLLLEVLNEAGASFAELPSWQATTSEQQIVLEGPMSESGLMRLFSFLELDTSMLDSPPSTETPQESAVGEASSDEDRYANDPAKITRDYYHSVQKYLNDLSHERGAKSYYSIAVWYDKYAKRIARLPILNVDTEMLDYSESVIGHLRAAADSIQAGGVKTAARGKQITAGGSDDYGYDYGGNGYRVFSGGANYAASQVAGVEAERRAIRAQEQAQSTLDAKGHLAAIEADTLRIRREMTEKYGVEF
jgi:hypothetical protein